MSWRDSRKSLKKMDGIEDSRVVLITGSSSGIEAASARLFARKGFRVAVTGSNQEKVDRVARECLVASPGGLKALPIVADLSNPENGELIVKRTVEHFGRLDVLINNAGVQYRTHSADSSTLELYRKTMTINVDSIVRASMAAIAHLEKTNGNIVFVVSSSTSSSRPSASGYAFEMSKAAISIYAKSLAADVAPKIRVNIVSLGPVAISTTEKVHHSRDSLHNRPAQAGSMEPSGNCDEIAGTIFYLASDEASFVNGAELLIDGGDLYQLPIND